MSPLEKTIKFYTEYIMSDNFHSIPDKKEVLIKVIKKYNLFFTTDRKIIDIEEEVYERNLNQTERDFFQYNLILGKDIMELTEEDIKTRFTDEYEGVKDRMFFRIELYKHGWSIDQIESYIYKYMLKMERPIINDVIHVNYYHNVMNCLKIIKNSMCKSKGRPKLPSSLSDYLKQKHTDLVKNNMREIYIQ
jgi:hypothetical protein